MTCKACGSPGGRRVEVPRSLFDPGGRTAIAVLCPACEDEWRFDLDDEAAMLGLIPGGRGGAALHLADDEDGEGPVPPRRREPPEACAGFSPELALFVAVLA